MPGIKFVVKKNVMLKKNKSDVYPGRLREITLRFEALDAAADSSDEDSDSEDDITDELDGLLGDGMAEGGEKELGRFSPPVSDDDQSPLPGSPLRHMA